MWSILIIVCFKIKCSWTFANIFAKKNCDEVFVGTISSQIAFSSDWHQEDNNQNWNKNFIAFLFKCRGLKSQRSHRRLWSPTRSPCPRRLPAPWSCCRRAHRTSSSHPVLGGHDRRLSASLRATRVRLLHSAPQRRGGSFVPRHNLPLDRRPNANELDRIQLAGSTVSSHDLVRELCWFTHVSSRKTMGVLCCLSCPQVMVAFENNIRTLLDTAPTRTLLVFESHRLQEPPESGVGNCMKKSWMFSLQAWRTAVIAGYFLRRKRAWTSQRTQPFKKSSIR